MNAPTFAQTFSPAEQEVLGKLQERYQEGVRQGTEAFTAWELRRLDFARWNLEHHGDACELERMA